MYSSSQDPSTTSHINHKTSEVASILRSTNNTSNVKTNRNQRNQKNSNSKSLKSPSSQPSSIQNQQQQQFGLPGYTHQQVAYPVVPFWTACPLPFNPVYYPQMILPTQAYSQQFPIGQELLRPVLNRIQNNNNKESTDPSQTNATPAGNNRTIWASPHEYEQQLQQLRMQLQQNQNESRYLQEKLESAKLELSRAKQEETVPKDETSNGDNNNCNNTDTTNNPNNPNVFYPGYYCMSYPNLVSNWQSPVYEVPQPFQQKIDFEKTRQGLRKTQENINKRTIVVADKTKNGSQEELNYGEDVSTMYSYEGETSMVAPSQEIQQQQNVHHPQSMNPSGSIHSHCNNGVNECGWIEEILLSESLDKSLDIDIEDLMEMDV